VRHPDEIGPLELQRELQCEWRLSPELARKLAFVMIDWQRETAIPMDVISGMRTRAEQQALIDSGRPAAPIHLSTHVMCPATGADVRMGYSFMTGMMKATFGRIVRMNGLRWGGGSPIDPSTGIPSDWNHVDLGPRTA